MKAPEAYRGREQTYLKHFFLERYLERVAYNLLSSRDEFVYVDGFSGPWKSGDEKYEDTSFVIALNLLRRVREGLRARGRTIRMRSLLNERDRGAYQELLKAIGSVTDIEVQPFCRDFEEVVPELVSSVGNAFSLTFIDPTGWTGFGLEKIQPLLRLPGEIIINFMFDYVNRFLEDPRPETAASFDPLFGGPGWFTEVQSLVEHGLSREDAVLAVYQHKLKTAGGFAYVTSTRILKPLADRSYFYLVYATRHWKGLVEFRAVEKKAVLEQERVRDDAKLAGRVSRTGQTELFGSGALTGMRTFEAERKANLERGHALLLEALRAAGTCSYEQLIGTCLELPLVWQTDLHDWLRELRKTGTVDIPQLTGRATTPKAGYQIIWRSER